MPIVPSFHGYVPQVQDSGAAGRATVEPPHVDSDSYSKLMAKATAPLDKLSNTFEDLAEREAARIIKANSDDVELQVMSTINRYMTGDGEHEGFLAKQGKNALDAYPETVENMQRDVEKKLIDVSPQVRDAVFGRVQDRVESAINRANMYREQESRRYQVNSLDAHTQFLMDSIAENYGDNAFIERSIASIIDDQIYKEKILGLPPEQTDAIVQELLGKAHYARFTAFAADNPEQAYAVFLSERNSIPGQVAAKLKKSLESAAVLPMAMKLAGIYEANPGLAGGGKANVNGKTGYALYDQLSPEAKLPVRLKALALMEHKQTTGRASLQREEVNSLASAAARGFDDRKLDESDYIAAYGEAEGKRRYAAYNDKFTTATTINSYSLMTNEMIRQDLTKDLPDRNADNYADQVKQYAARVKAAAQVFQTRQDNAVGEMKKLGVFGDIRDWDNAADEIAARVPDAEQWSSNFGVDLTILSSEEATSLKAKLGSLSPMEASGWLDRNMASLPREAQASIAKQLGGDIGLAAALASDSWTRGKGVTSLYLVGKQAINIKDERVKALQAATTVSGLRAQYERLDGVLEQPSDRSAAMDQVQGVAAGIMLTEGVSAQKAWREAFSRVLGDIVNYKDRGIVLRGATESDVKRAVENAREKLKADKDPVVLTSRGTALTGEQFAAYLSNAQLMQAKGGDNLFNVIHYDSVITNPDGTPFVIDANGAAMARVAVRKTSDNLKVPDVSQFDEFGYPVEPSETTDNVE